MILPFSTQINGKPTNFVSKIWIGIEYKFSDFGKGNRLFNFPKEYIECGQKGLLTFQKPKPKLHTIREDKNDRWKPGVMIDFFINARQKNMFRFAPRIPVRSIQKVYMSYAYNNIIEISIDGRQIHDASQLLEFAINDGFDTWDDFFNYFYPAIKATPDNWLERKLIHWTDKRY